MPTPLLVAAPAIPATWVPCPQGSVGVPAAQPPRQVAPEEVSSEARSSCVAATPVSTIPIGAPAAGEKVAGKTDQPPSAAMAGRAHCSA
jgi:hypothetical protein